MWISVDIGKQFCLRNKISLEYFVCVLVVYVWDISEIYILSFGWIFHEDTRTPSQYLLP
jgi:hypothetical protein